MYSVRRKRKNQEIINEARARIEKRENKMEMALQISGVILMILTIALQPNFSQICIEGICGVYLLLCLGLVSSACISLRWGRKEKIKRTVILCVFCAIVFCVAYI